MNERIKELAKQAGIEFTYDPSETPMRAFAECWVDDMEKFAELIVRECMALNSKELSILAIERLLPLYQEHFGVEE